MLTVVKRSEADLAQWLATEAGFIEGVCRFDEEPVTLDGYQHWFVGQDGKYRCVEKSRQVGYSFVFALEAFARCHLRETQTSVFVSYNLSDSKEKVQYARQLYEELPLQYRKKLIVDSKLELAFESNSASKRVSRIISNPSRAPRGKKGDIYLDELAHYADDRTVYKGSTALILRSKGQLSICSTPMGRRGVFWEIAQQELKPYSAYKRQRVPWWLCRFFCTSVEEAAKLAPAMTTEERVAAFGSEGIRDQFDSLLLEDFQQEFECFPAGTNIETVNGPQPIELIREGDLVRTHEGRLMPVTKTGSRSYSGELVSVRTYHHQRPVTATPEHPVLAARFEPCKWKRQVRCYPWCKQKCAHKVKELPRPEFVPLGEITTQHALVSPVPVVDQSLVPKAFCFNDWYDIPSGFRSKNKIPASIPITKKFMRFVGYYLAEGSTESSGRRLTLSFGAHELDLIEDAKQLVSDLFGLRADFRRVGNSGIVALNSFIVARAFKGAFGAHAELKRIPSDWINLPLERLDDLLAGYLAGDGHQKEGLVMVGTVSQTLSRQVYAIMLRLGWLPSVSERLPTVGRIDDRPIIGRHVFHLLYVYPATTTDRRGARGWNDGTFAYFPVKSVQSSDHDDKVYNLEVAEDNSYLAELRAVHNCLYVDETHSFFPYSLIIPCTKDVSDGEYGDLEFWHDPSDAGEVSGRLVAGYDVGRHRDLSELAIFEESEGRPKYRCRMLKTFDRVPFAEQEAYLRHLLDVLPIGRISIDATGIGMQLAENLSRDYPQAQADTFTAKNKELWCNDFKIHLQRRDIVLPSDRDLVSQIHSIRKKITASGATQFEAENTGRGHADRFWACALAVQKERKPVGKTERVRFRVIG